MRIFGIDPGSERTGYGCVDTDGHRHRLVDCGAIKALYRERAHYADTPHIGQWLKKNQNLTVNQQEQALKDDPEFQKLPPQQQQHLIDRLHQFNNLSPEERQKMLMRMDLFEHLTPEQRDIFTSVYEGVLQLKDIVDNLLSISRIEAKGLVLRFRRGTPLPERCLFLSR